MCYFILNKYRGGCLARTWFRPIKHQRHLNKHVIWAYLFTLTTCIPFTSLNSYIRGQTILSAWNHSSQCRIKMSDLQKHTSQQRFQPRHGCRLHKIVINWKMWRIICLSKSRRRYNLQIFCWLRPSAPVFKALWTPCNLFERTRMSNTCAYCTSTDLEQLQYDLCEDSTKSQVPTFSLGSSSQVPLVAAGNFRLGSSNK